LFVHVIPSQTKIVLYVQSIKLVYKANIITSQR